MIMEPTEEIRALCEDIERLIRAYLEAPHPQPIGRFESNVEAYTMLKLMIRHSEAVVELARHDLVLLPAALVLARACFEASLRTRWMLGPEDPFEREVRWILHLRTARDHCRKLAQNVHILPQFRKQYEGRGSSYESFMTDIEQMLNERGYSTPAKVPKVWDMVNDLDEPQLYVFYILLSAYTHSNFEAGSLYRQNLGCGKKLGEFITPGSWQFPLEVTWRSFFATAHEFLERIDADRSRFQAEAAPAKFEEHLRKLGSG